MADGFPFPVPPPCGRSRPENACNLHAPSTPRPRHRKWGLAPQRSAGACTHFRSAPVPGLVTNPGRLVPGCFRPGSGKHRPQLGIDDRYSKVPRRETDRRPTAGQIGVLTLTATLRVTNPRDGRFEQMTDCHWRLLTRNLQSPISNPQSSIVIRQSPGCFSSLSGAN